MINAEKILIIEDNAIIIPSLSMILKSHGYFVTTARTGKDALEEVQTTHNNMVLLDIGPPDMTGTEILKK